METQEFQRAGASLLNALDWKLILVMVHCTYPRKDGQAELTWAAG